MRPNQRPCPGCGEPMGRQAKSCRACYDATRALTARYVQYACDWCGAEIRMHEVHLARSEGHYCSRSCARRGRPTRKRTRKIVVCASCSTEIERHVSEIARSRRGLHFCSLECWYAHNTGESHYLWTGGQSGRVGQGGWRRAVLERDRGFCRICHSTDRLEAHHIRMFGKYPEHRWEVENGVTLCRDCHRRFRGREDDYIAELSLIASVPVEVWG